MRCRELILASIAFALISLVGAYSANMQAFWLGLDSPPAVLELRSARDSLPSRSGTVHFLVLEGVRDGRGSRSDARGRILAYSRDHTELPWGARFEARLKSEPELLIEAGEFQEIEILADTIRMSPFQRRRASMREELTRRIVRLGPEAGELLSALLIGRRSRLLIYLSSRFRSIGCAHLLALSGMHLAVLLGLVGGFLRLFFPRPVARVLPLLLLPGYLLLVGPAASLLRAGVMYGILRLRPQGRVTPALVSLLQVYVLLLVLNPALLADYGFIFSFAALGGLCVFSPPLLRLYLGAGLPPWIAAGLSASCGAYIGALPAALLIFGETNPIGMIAALFLTPLIWCTLSLGAIALLLPGMPILAAGSRILFFLLYRSLDSVSRWFTLFAPLSLSEAWAYAVLGGTALLFLLRILYASRQPGRLSDAGKSEFKSRGPSAVRESRTDSQEAFRPEFPNRC